MFSVVLTVLCVSSFSQESISLNGSWLFRHAKNTREADSIIFFSSVLDDLKSYDHINIPSCWSMLGYEKPFYRRMKGREPGEGFYRKFFTIPQEWLKRRVELNFGGIWASAEIWLNSENIGRHDSGFTSFSVDLTGKLKIMNDLLIRVRQKYPGFEMDVYDDWLLPGIYRDVVLESMPAGRWIDNVVSVTDFDNHHISADLNLKVMVGDMHKETLPGNYPSPGNPYQLRFTLKDAKGKTVGSKIQSVQAHIATMREIKETIHMNKPYQWTAETPYLYNLSVELLEKGVVTHKRNLKIGFRDISTETGILKINGKIVKLRGINHHDEYPDVGRATMHEHWLKDLKLMKQANINYIRACHYQSAKGFIELCDSIGMYVGEEVSMGSNNRSVYFSENHIGQSLQRAYETITRDQNNASIIYWSVGNEVPLTQQHFAALKAIKAWDKTRPILIPWRADEWLPKEVDIRAPHYWTTDLYDSISAHSDRPVITTEYTHSFGYYGFGGLEDRWNALIRHDAGAGGAVWMWADQGIVLPYKKLSKDHSDDPHLWVPNDGWDGIVDSYRKLTRDYYELKAVYAPVRTAIDSVFISGSTVQIPIKNDYDFISTNGIVVRWKVFVDSKIVNAGELPIMIQPHKQDIITVPINKLKVKDGESAYAWFSFIAKDGHEIGKNYVELLHNCKTVDIYKNNSHPKLVDDANTTIVYGKNYKIVFSKSTGMPVSINGVLKNFHPTIWHKMNDGDEVVKKRNMNANKYNISVKSYDAVILNDSVIVTSCVDYQIDDKNMFSVDYRYSIGGNGELNLSYVIKTVVNTEMLPLIGIEAEIPSAKSMKRWMGLGPEDAYPNKHASTLLGIWNAENVAGTHQVRWIDIDKVRVYVNGYIDRDDITDTSVRFLSHVNGRPEKGRLEKEYQIRSRGIYYGAIKIK